MSNSQASLKAILGKAIFDTSKPSLTLADPRDEKSFVSVPYPLKKSTSDHSELQKEFQRIIYKYYNYDKTNLDDIKKDEGDMWVPDFAEQEIQRDLFWDLESVETDNTVVARKDSERVRIPDGSYYKIGEVGNKKKIHIITSRYTFQSNDKTNVEFIHIYGRYILKDEEGEDTLRFYFNLKPNKKAITQWSTALVHRLNDRAIPFNLKYIKQLASYDRADAGVLYIQKNNFTVAAPIIRQAYNRLLYNNAIREQVPLFCYKLLPGFGFAESPLKRGVSFGMDVSRKITDGLFEYLEENENSGNVDLDKIIEFIEEKKFPSKFENAYFNADLKRTYDFELFLKSTKFQLFPKRKVFLRAASYFANILKEKAIWINGQRTWITYTEVITNNGMSPKKQVGFRLVNETEREGVEFFLQNFESVLNTGKIALSEISNQISAPVIKYKEGEAFDKMINMIHSSEKEQENLKYARDFIKKFIKIRFPLPNAYGRDNPEFCPTISHGLAFFGYFFLFMHCSVHHLCSVGNMHLPTLKDFLNIK